MLPVHECVPFAGTQVTLSVLSSTLWMPTSSEAFPATVIVTVGVKTKLEFFGELMAICGGVVSGIGSPARTSTVIETVWTRLPCRAVPKTSTVYHPSAVPDRVQVEVPLPSIVEGEQVPVIPPGTETAVRSTGPLKPLVDCNWIVDVADCPATKERLVGSARSEKSGMGTGVTVTSIEVVCVRLPLVPVMVAVYDPIELAFSVHVAEALPTRLEGEQTVVTPIGAEAVVRSTVPEKPLTDCKATVEVDESFTTKETLFGLALREKSGVVTVAATAVLWATLPFVPVIVTV